MNSLHDARHYQRVMHIVDSLMDCEPAELEARLKEECAGDDSLLREVEELLAEDKPASSFLEESPLNALSLPPLAEEEDRFIGKLIGSYRITEEIGRGGMGAVYRAVRADDQYHTEVAIKLIKRGMDTDAILRRFRNERQILANLSHPNIARLLDGGTTGDGLPYFVMEHVAGKPVNEYCNENNLSTAERLKLFRIVCKPLQYAHQNLVIHRDLKPTNILVTEDGTPKLLDFGIAKLLDPESHQPAPLTATELRVMTPEYASPEQVKGERVTTASDVYSLGVLLYELLTGQRPYRFKSRRPDEIFRVVCEQEPEKPSTAISHAKEPSKGNVLTDTLPSTNQRHDYQTQALRSHLRGDLDTIVLMALRKEPARRYAGVEQFSEDIRRHLEGHPVLAHRDTLSYRSAKFLKRNKLTVGAATLVFMMLLGGIVATTWQARVARAERAKAERRFNDVRQLANSLLFELNDQIELGPTKARELLVRRALQYLDSLAVEAGNDLSLKRELAAAYQRVGDVQSQLHRANIGDSQGALTSYQKALVLREAIAAANPTDIQANFDLAVSYNRAGDILSKTGNTPSALERYRRALTLFERIQSEAPDSAVMMREMSGNYLALGRAQLKTGDSIETLINFRKAKAVLEALAVQNPHDVPIQRDLSAAFASIAFVLMESGKTAEAFEIARKALEICERLSASDPANSLFRRSLHSSEWMMGLILRDAAEIGQATDHHKKALAIAQELFNADPTNTQARNDLADAYLEIGNTLRTARQTSAALGHYREAIQNYEAVAAADRNNVHARRQIYFSRMHMGDAQAQAGDTSGALETFRQTVASFRELTTQDDGNTEFRNDLAISYRKLGEVLVKTGDSGTALENLRQALPLIESISAQSPMNAGKRRDLALTYSGFGMAYVTSASQKRSSDVQRNAHLLEARISFQKSLDIWQHMKATGTLIALEAGKPDEVSREIARIDQLLKQKLVAELTS